MIVIPAVDIRGGKCVRLLQGDYDRETVFSHDPAAMAARWQAEGAERLHLVDLDGARQGRPVNLEVIRRIAAATDIPLQLGGGLRTASDIEDALRAGVQRAIIGTAVLDPVLAAELLQRFGQSLIIGLDARQGMVAVNGWLQQSDVPVSQLALQMKSLGAARIIYTDISRDGAMQGPNIAATAELARLSGLPVIASGGVSSLEQIRQLADLEADGIEAAIVGRALYDGTLRLPEAMAAGRTAEVE